MKILRLSDTPVEKASAEAAKILHSGGLVLFPTDTLYGLAADALNPKALHKLRELKGREKKKPIAVIVPSASDIGTYVRMNPEADRLAAAHLPGALTLVLPALPQVPEELLLNGALGIRVPADPFALTLAHALGRPYTATSANKAGAQTPTTIAEIIRHFGVHAADIDLIIDDGERAGGKASTVVSFIDGVGHVIREGALSKQELGL